MKIDSECCVILIAMSDIEFEIDDLAIARVTINRPERKNAVTSEMWGSLGDIFDEVATNPSARAMVLQGAGGAFCAGADLSGRRIGADGDQLASMRRIGKVAESLFRLPKPTIAKVTGVAVGAGCNMALACDLIVASESARFSEIFVKRGLSLDFGGSYILPRLIGLHRAKELALFGDILSAQEAKEMGIVNRVVADDAIDDFVDGWAKRLASGPSIAQSLSKSMLNDSLNRSLIDSLEAETFAQTINFKSDDTAEAIKAFLEKREPNFTGR